MARPRVFVSSTYYDLKHIRSSLETFIESLGFDAVLFEKGDIAFHPDAALDESCYREASAADIFVLVIGGRYGSAASTAQAATSRKFFEQYESVTRKEFEAAQQADVPTFILVDSAVHSEYQTYRRNRDNKDIKYAHVDSVGVFQLIESIFEKGRNNPTFGFERATEIETWLREQWSGLFRELLRSRSQQKQLSTLNSQVAELQSINETLKTYLEAVLAKVTPADAAEIIKDQEAKLIETRKVIDLSSNNLFKYLVSDRGVSDETAQSIIEKPNDPEEAIDLFEKAFSNRGESARRILRYSPMAQNDYNAARLIVGRPKLDFLQIDKDSPIVKSRGAKDITGTPAKASTRKRANPKS